MARAQKTVSRRIARALTDAVWEQTLREMRAVDRLLAPRDHRGPAVGNSSVRRGKKRPDAARSARRAPRWHGFRTVLCAVDFSEASRLALRYAAALARRADASLRVLYVNDPLLIAAAAAALHDRQVVDRSRRELRAFVDATLAPASGHGAPPAVDVATGDPATEILALARRTAADLLVVGTHGLTGAARVIVGSTTLGLLQRATIPILAVPVTGETALPVPAAWPGRRIVAAIELDGDARREAEIAAGLAAWFHAGLLLVHVVSAVRAPAWLPGDLSAHDRVRFAQARQRLDRLASVVRARVKAETRVVCGQPADEIAATAVSEHAGLLVAALRDRRGWFGARRGSISYHVLSHAVAPVLAYPPAWTPR